MLVAIQNVLRLTATDHNLLPMWAQVEATAQHVGSLKSCPQFRSSTE